MNPTFQHMPVKSTTKRCTTYVPFAIKYLLPSYKQNIFHTSEILKDFFSYNYVKNVLYLKIKSVIRLTGTRMKNPVDNREASVSGRCFWSQKGPDRILETQVYLLQYRSLIFFVLQVLFHFSFPFLEICTKAVAAKVTYCLNF